MAKNSKVKKNTPWMVKQNKETKSLKLEKTDDNILKVQVKDVVEEVVQVQEETIGKDKMKSILNPKEDDLNYDLKNLLVIDTHSIDLKKFEQDDMDYLDEYSRENMQLLMNKMFQLPLTQIENSMFVTLPAQEVVKTPRARPPPQPKEETKWEKFAKENNIRKNKRDKLVYDPNTDEFRPAYGYKKTTKKELDWMVPAKSTDSVGSDPFIEQRTANRRQKMKQKLNEIKNKINAAEKKKVPGQVEVASAMKMTYKKMKNSMKGGLETAYNAARVSTASMGMFDKKASNLEKKRTELGKGRKRKRVEFESEKVNPKENNSSLKILDRVLMTESKRKKRILESSLAANVYQKNTEKQTRKEKKKHFVGERKQMYKK